MQQNRLIIDVGNSSTKAAILCMGEPQKEYKWEGENIDYDELARAISDFFIEKAIISSVKHHNSAIFSFLNNMGVQLVEFTVDMVLPITNCYKTPLTLGRDRLAAAIGAMTIFGDNSNILVVDLGSAITIDMVVDGCYLGGNISAGASLRFRSLANFTDKLPLLSLHQESDGELFSRNTNSAIVEGVVCGIVGELEWYIQKAQREHGNINVIFTGGDANYFEKKIKNTIFVNYNLVIVGLNRVLDEIEINEKRG